MMTLSALPSWLQPGSLVAVRSQGVLRSVGLVEDDGIPRVELIHPEYGTRVLLPVEEAGAVARPLVTPEEAERLLGRLRSPGGADDRPWNAIYVAGMKALAEGTLEDAVERLLAMYAGRWAPSFGERKLIDRLEETVLGELGAVLGLTREALGSELQAASVTFAASEPRPPSPHEDASGEVPVLEGFEVLGAATLTSPVVITSSAKRPEAGFPLEVAPGRWYAWLTAEERDADEEEPLEHCLLLHESATASVPAFSEADAQNVEVGHQLVVLSRAAFADGALVDDVHYLGGMRAVASGFSLSTLGPGECSVATFARGGSILGLRISL